MKKRIFICLCILASLITGQAKAVSYRGFADVAGGLFSYGDSMGINAGVSTTHGLQVAKSVFVGVGVGYNYRSNFGDFYADGCTKSFHTNSLINAFVDVRWDGFGLFGKYSKVSPFVDLKVGYQNAVSGYVKGKVGYDSFDLSYSTGELLYSSTPSKGKIKHPSGVIVRPTLGVRIGLNSHVGLNVGIYCDVLNLVRLNKVYTGYVEPYPNPKPPTWSYDTDIWEIRKVYFPGQDIYCNPFGINIGVDF